MGSLLLRNFYGRQKVLTEVKTVETGKECALLKDTCFDPYMMNIFCTIRVGYEVFECTRLKPSPTTYIFLKALFRAWQSIEAFIVEIFYALRFFCAIAAIEKTFSSIRDCFRLKSETFIFHLRLNFRLKLQNTANEQERRASIFSNWLRLMEKFSPAQELMLNNWTFKSQFFIPDIERRRDENFRRRNEKRPPTRSNYVFRRNFRGWKLPRLSFV